MRHSPAAADRHRRHLAFADYARDPRPEGVPAWLPRLHARWLRGGERYLGAARATPCGPPPDDWRAAFDEADLAADPRWGDPLPAALEA